jgi:hypothetical protein|tara:strand:- start:231 stop:416 length:186 start_codon:yes stop_codon:yes gene_type:complete
MAMPPIPSITGGDAGPATSSTGATGSSIGDTVLNIGGNPNRSKGVDYLPFILIGFVVFLLR